MSKAFTRELDDAPEVPVRRLSTIVPLGIANYLTARGERRLREELQKLVASGALPESRQRIAEIEESLTSAVIIEPPPKPWEQVSFGATVTVRDQKGELQRYRIVGIAETDLDNNEISWLSPLAKALLKKRVGDIAKFKTPDGEQTLQVLDVKF